MTDYWSRKLNDEIQIVQREISPPEEGTFDDLMQWQSRLKAAVNNVVASRMSPALSSELSNRFGTSFEEKKSLCKWGNQILAELDAYVKLADGEIGFFSACRGNARDAGRIYVEQLGEARRIKNLAPSFEVELTPNLHRLRCNRRSFLGR